MQFYCPYCMTAVQPGVCCPSCGRDPASYQPASHHFPPGRLLHDRYLVGKVLGEGGFGITYLGIDTVLERLVAVKEYFPTIYVRRESSLTLDVTCYTDVKQALYEKGRDQFLQEARVMARFDKIPEMVQVLDFFAANNTAYIVMEFLEGDTLRTLLARQGCIPASRLLEMMEPVLRAMDIMHGVGIIHRDISPDNLILLPSGQLKLLDFGCARETEGGHTMTVMLKHGYAPMEQYTGHNQGPWTDLYALCATIYRCLTGKVPPQALDRLGKTEDPLMPPNALGAGLTPGQERTLLRGLAVDPSARLQSAAELYAGLYGRTIAGIPVQDTNETVLLLDEQPPGPVPPQSPLKDSALTRLPMWSVSPLLNLLDRSKIPRWMIVALFALAQSVTAGIYLLEIAFCKWTSGVSLFLGAFGRRILYPYIILAPLLAAALLAALYFKKGHKPACLLSAALQLPVLIRFFRLSGGSVIMFVFPVHALYGGLWHLLLLLWAWGCLYVVGQDNIQRTNSGTP